MRKRPYHIHYQKMIFFLQKILFLICLKLVKFLNNFFRLQPLSDVVPRLWPFLSHSTSSVRRATLQTLRTLTGMSLQDKNLQWTASLLQDALRHIFQRALVEPIPEIQDLCEQVNWLPLKFITYVKLNTVRSRSIL